VEAERNPGYSSPIKQALKGRNGRLTKRFALSGLGFFWQTTQGVALGYLI
jgi:hypothetical protein